MTCVYIKEKKAGRFHIQKPEMDIIKTPKFKAVYINLFTFFDYIFYVRIQRELLYSVNIENNGYSEVSRFETGEYII